MKKEGASKERNKLRMREYHVELSEKKKGNQVLWP